MQAAELLARARRVRIHGRGLAYAPLTGEYRCAFRGSGIEFEDIREYAPGDDVSAIDWKVTARLGRPYVKRFREERQRTLVVAVDVSRSMTFGSPPLAETAAEAAVVLAISSAASRDQVGCLLFSDRVEGFVPPRKGPGQAFAVASALAEVRPAGKATDPGPALAFLAATLRRRAILFVLSDFLSDIDSPAWGRLAARHDLTAAFVAVPDMERLPASGLLAVADLETGRETLLDCGDPRVKARYAAARLDRRRRTMTALRAAGTDILELPANGPMAPALAAFFSAED